jgi:hypothetical protein
MEATLKSLMTLLQLVLIELGTRCGTSTTLDWKTIERRFEHESLSFLTITMPAFCRDFEKSLEEGKVAPDSFSSFRKRAGLPLFLRGFLELVFEPGSARLLPDASVEAIFSIRQITLMFKKILVDCTDDRRHAAFQKYLEVEQDVRLSDQRLLSESDRVRSFERIGQLLWADFFSSVDNRIYNDSVVPKHGPGATADKLRGNAKYVNSMWTRRLEQVFPFGIYLLPNPSVEFLQRVDEVTILEPGEEMPVRVISVPKTLKTPRIIAIEPTCMQYMQQGVLSVMMEEMPRFDQTRNLVMFEEQEPNQRLALEGSLTGTLATLDLSEASDRVSNQHVRSLVRNHRFLREALDATRSRKADVPTKNGLETIRLSKFASMGSALCFPMEAIVFTTIIFMAIEKSLNRRLTIKDVRSFYGRVRVYGDDIIVPVDHVQAVIEELEAFGLLVNRNKSFWNGKFRESCGKDYYGGEDVSVTYVRRFLPDNRLQAEEVISAVALRNQLFQAGFVTTVDWLDDRIRKLIPFPIVEPTSPLLGRWSHSPYEAEMHHPDLHVPLVRGVYISPKRRESLLDGYGALQKFFLRVHSGREVGDSPPIYRLDKDGKPSLPGGPVMRARNWLDRVVATDKDHLQFAGRPVSVRIKNGWSTPY